MAEIPAFIYGWMAGIFAVIIWILYGIDTLLQLMRVVNDTFARLPGLSHLAHKQKEKKSRDGESNRGGTSKFNVLTSEEGLEGLTGSTKRVTPITAGGVCMMSWYGPDGTTGSPIECRLSLENNEVTIYQLLRVGDTNTGMAGSTSGNASGSARGSSGQLGVAATSGRRGSKDCDTNSLRSAAGVTVAEHRKGRVSVLNTTVMELRHFNKPKKSTGEQGSGGGAKSNGNRNKAADNGSEAGSLSASQRGGRSRQGAEADANGSVAGTPNGSRHHRKESGGSGNGNGSAREGQPGNEGNNNNNSNNNSGGANPGNGGAPLEGATRPGVDPIFNGRVLIWRTMDGCALFDSARVAQSKSSATFSNSTNTLSGSARRGGSNGSASQSGTAPSFSASPSADSLFDDRSANGSAEDDEGGSDDHCDDVTGGGSGVSGDEQQGSGHGEKNRQHRGHHHTGRRHRKHSSEMGDMANWSCVIIKFERARESERWHTLLSGLKEARAWHDFAKTLPNPDTVNTFLSRFFFQNMRANGLADAIIKQIRKKLRELPAKKFPRDLGGQLILDEFLIGTQIPWITDVSEPTVSANGEVGFDFNLLYKGGEGGFTLFFRLALEFLGIRVPHAVFSVKLIELEATVHISIGPPPSKKFWIGGHKPPILRLEVHQGCASGRGILHRVLTSLPDLSGILTNLIKLYLFSDMVLPYMDDFPLPSVVKSPKSSMRDMRVRTFDRQRAAKISGAPARVSSAPIAAPASPVAAEDASRSAKPSSTLAGSRRSSGAQNAAEGTTAQAPVPTTPQPPSQKATSQLATPRENLADTANRKDRNSFSNPSFTSGQAQDVVSPIVLTSPNNPSANSFRGSREGNAGSSGNIQNTSTLTANRTMTGSVLNRTVQSETEVTESEEALSATAKRRGGGSSTMRNLKSLLKVKGNDMTRESVSRSKDKRKT